MFPRGQLRKGSNNFGIPTGPRTKHIQTQGLSSDAEHLGMGLKDSSFHPIEHCYSQNPARKTSQPVGAPGSSASVETGSMDSPSLGSDSVIINHVTNSAEGRAQNGESLGDDLESPDFVGGRKKKRGSRPGGPEKGGRGLRHFSMKVCEKVESKGRTTYNEVADELVAEFTNGDSLLATPDQQQYDEKNIRRRVYDALNVLMAMDIISKEKKEIQWKGLPSTVVDDVESLKAEHMQTRGRIEKKAAYLKDLEEQIIGIQKLIERNESQFHGGAPANGVALPFILVQTRPYATVEVEISEDMQSVHFDFNNTPFELHDDAYVLKAMRLHNGANDMQDNETQLLKPELAEDDKSIALHSSIHNSLPLMNSSAHQYQCLPTKAANAHPSPAILKGRVKQENN